MDENSDLGVANKIAKGFRDDGNESALNQFQVDFMNDCRDAQKQGNAEALAVGDCATTAKNLGLNEVSITGAMQASDHNFGKQK